MDANYVLDWLERNRDLAFLHRKKFSVSRDVVASFEEEAFFMGLIIALAFKERNLKTKSKFANQLFDWMFKEGILIEFKEESTDE